MGKALRKAKRMTIKRLPLTQARNHLGQIVRRAHLNREVFILEKDGIPLALVQGFHNSDEVEDWLDLHDPKILAAMKQAREDYRAGRTRPASELTAELQAIAAKSKGSHRRSRKQTRS